MGDTEETNGGAADSSADTGADVDTEVTTDDEPDTSTNSDGEDDGDESSDDGEDGGKGDSQETDTATDDTEEIVDDGEVPELRKPKAGDSNAKWAAWRAQQKEKREKSGQSGESSDGTEDGAQEETTDDDPIAKEVAKQMAPFKQKAAEQEVDTEIASFLAKNPDFKPFESKVRRWALHPNRDGVPVTAIFYEVAGEKLMALGAKRAKAADQKANSKKIAGGQPAGEKGSTSFKDMPLSDFGKELENAKLKR